MRYTGTLNVSEFCLCRECHLLHSDSFLKNADIRALGMYFRSHPGKEFRAEALEYLKSINGDETSCKGKDKKGEALSVDGIEAPNGLVQILTDSFRSETRDLKNELAELLSHSADDETPGMEDIIRKSIHLVEKASRHLLDLFEQNKKAKFEEFTELLNNAMEPYYLARCSVLEREKLANSDINRGKRAASYRDRMVAILQKHFRVQSEDDGYNSSRKLLTSEISYCNKQAQNLQSIITEEVTSFFQLLSRAAPYKPFIMRLCGTNFYCYEFLTNHILNSYQMDEHREVLLVISLFIIRVLHFIANDFSGVFSWRRKMESCIINKCVNKRYYVDIKQTPSEELINHIRAFFESWAYLIPKTVPDIATEKSKSNQVYVGVFLDTFGRTIFRQVYWKKECWNTEFLVADMRSIFIPSEQDGPEIVRRITKKKGSATKKRKSEKVKKKSEDEDVKSDDPLENPIVPADPVSSSAATESKDEMDDFELIEFEDLGITEENPPKSPRTSEQTSE